MNVDSDRDSADSPQVSEDAPQSRPTIRDVARLAGVSAGTVSNVLNRPSYVSNETRERVESVIKSLNFSPRQRSRQFRPGRVRTIGISVANLDNPFFVDLALSAEEVAHRHGLGVVICNSAYDPIRESQNLDLLVQQRVQGIIISPIDENSSGIEMLRGRGVPMVFVDRVGNNRDCWSVVIDDIIGGRLGANHLVNRGHKKIGFLGHPDRSPKVRNRLAGAQEVITRGSGEHSLEVLFADSWTIEAGRAAADALLKRAENERPTAVFCANDMLALGLMQVYLQEGLSVPHDLAILGYDNLIWGEVAQVPLTTIDQPRALLGTTAVEMLMKLIDAPGEQPVSNHVVLSPTLKIRESA